MRPLSCKKFILSMCFVTLTFSVIFLLTRDQANLKLKAKSTALDLTTRLSDRLDKFKNYLAENDLLESDISTIKLEDGKQGLELREIILPKKVMDNIKKFVFFIGYPRSGHSIVGSIMDAHPHMIIAHEFMMFRKWKSIASLNMSTQERRQYLFNSLYQDSYNDKVEGWRSQALLKRKGYTLDIDYPWQGSYDRFVDVIGDKSGGVTTYSFLAKIFQGYYSQILQTVKLPVRVFHVVRNPYDLISTNTLYWEHKMSNSSFAHKSGSYVQAMKSHMHQGDFKFNNETSLEIKIKRVFNLVDAVERMKGIIGKENVLDIHGRDLVHDPKTTIQTICDFVGLESPDSYLQACESKVYRNVSRSRNMVVWPQRLKDVVAHRMKKYDFFDGYTWESD